MRPNHELPGIRPNKFSAVERSPEEVSAGVPKTVAMNFPARVTLTISHGECVTYPAGVHQVPEILSTHWYLKACGATVQAAE